MSRGLYGFASLKGEVGVETGGSWLVLGGEEYTDLQGVRRGVGMAGGCRIRPTPISRIDKEVV